MAAIRGRLPQAEELSVYLDAFAIFLAITAVILAAYGAQLAGIGLLGAAVLVTYPIIHLATAGAGLVALLALRASPRGGRPDRLELPSDLGEALERAGDLTGAESAFLEAHRQQPSSDAALGLLRIGAVRGRAVLVAEAVRELAALGDAETAPVLFAPFATRHMHEFGTTPEMLASVAVKNHHNGCLDPYAHFQSEVTAAAKIPISRVGERRPAVAARVLVI